MDRTYVAAYRDLYLRHWWWRSREERIVSVLEALQPEHGWGAILDVGCGDGLFFDVLARFGRVVEGIEMDPAAVRPQGPAADRIRLGPFDETFVPGTKYGLVLMLDVLEHLPDPVGSLRRAADLLEPGGKIVLTVPAFPSLWTSHDTLNHHFVRFTRASLAETARRAGVRILDGRYFFGWTAPIKLLVRAKERLFGATPRPPSVPPTWLNRALYLLSRAEDGVFRRIRLPFGSSLLAVAEDERGTP